MARTAPTTRRVTLNEVARKAGVSVASASLVLAGKAAEMRLSAEVLARVEAAAIELDYIPNRLVHSLQQGSTQILAFLNGYRDRDVRDLYMDTLSSAIERAAGDLGFDVLVNCNFTRTPEQMYRHLNGGHADGLLFFAPALEDPLLPFLRASRMPTVLIGAHDKMNVISSVRDDAASGMRMVADALYSRGHRNIGVLTQSGMPDACDRTDMLRKFLGEKGVIIPDEWIIDYKGDSAPVLEQMLRQSHRPTALFCRTDRLAYELLAKHNRVRSVPDSLSIVGYDGLIWPAETRHTVASVHVDLATLAREAVALLISRIRQPDQPVVGLEIPVSFQEGTTLSTVRTID